MPDDRLLIVDDEPANTAVLERLLQRWGFDEVTSTNDSSAAVDLFHRCNPDLVLLDLHMPDPNGFELLRRLPHEVDGVSVPILVLTADVTSETKHDALAGGAQDFLTKPFDPDEVRLRVANLLKTRRLEIDLHSHSTTLEQAVSERTHELDDARRETLAKLARAAEFRDDSTGEHIHRVARTTAQLARAMGASPQEVETLRQAAALHDVGKIGIPDAILLKPGRLTDAEFARMKQHTELGARILEGSSSPVLHAASEIALTHHERWDGTGYPNGLASEQIPLSGRLVAVADVFDALTTQRPYKDAWPVEKAVEEIASQAGRHFDPEMVATFYALDPVALTKPVPVEERG